MKCDKILNIIAISVFILMVLLLMAGMVLTILEAIDGCESVSKTEIVAEQSQQRFQRVIRDEGSPFIVYVDTETNVMYAVRSSAGGVCVMVDADGKPLLWGGEKTQ